jgi:hypothetical protein
MESLQTSCFHGRKLKTANACQSSRLQFPRHCAHGRALASGCSQVEEEGMLPQSRRLRKRETQRGGEPEIELKLRTKIKMAHV